MKTDQIVHTEINIVSSYLQTLTHWHCALIIETKVFVLKLSEILTVHINLMIDNIIEAKLPIISWI